MDNKYLQFFRPHSKPDLTPRQREVAELVTAGKDNKDIAQILGVSVQAVKGTVRLCRRKLNAENRVLLAVKYDRMKR